MAKSARHTAAGDRTDDMGPSRAADRCLSPRSWARMSVAARGACYCQCWPVGHLCCFLTRPVHLLETVPLRTSAGEACCNILLAALCSLLRRRKKKKSLILLLPFLLLLLLLVLLLTIISPSYVSRDIRCILETEFALPLFLSSFLLIFFIRNLVLSVEASCEVWLSCPYIITITDYNRSCPAFSPPIAPSFSALQHSIVTYCPFSQHSLIPNVSGLIRCSSPPCRHSTTSILSRSSLQPFRSCICGLLAVLFSTLYFRPTWQPRPPADR